MAGKAGPSKTAAQRSLELGAYFTQGRLRVFSFDYKRFPQLWSKSFAKDEENKMAHGAGACAGLATRLRLLRGAGTCERVLGLCRHFHRLLFQELLVACSKEDGRRQTSNDPDSVCEHLPSWARHANRYLGMLEAALKAYQAAKNKKDLAAIMESAIIPMPVHAAEGARRPRPGAARARLVRALRRARAQGFAPALHAAARRLDRTPAELNKMWCSLRRSSHRSLRSLLRRSDRADSLPRPPTALVWAAADLAVYFGVSVLSREHLKDDSCLVALIYTFHLVQRCGLEAPGGPPPPALWARAAAEYTRSGHTCSALVLQRRWYELKRATRQTLLSAWRDHRRPEPPPLLQAIACRYPHVVTEPVCSWSELVQRGALARPTSERGPLPGEESAGADSSDAESDKDDDLILVEETIETINLDEDSDPKTPTKNVDEADNTSSEPKSPPSKNMPFLDTEDTLSDPFPQDNDPIFNENSHDEDTELQRDGETPKSPDSDNVVEALKSLDVGAVQMTIQFDDDDEFDDASDENENRDGTEVVSESAGGSNDVTVNHKNQATKSNETVNKTCDTGNENQNAGLSKIRDVISMQVESCVDKTPVIKRTDEMIKDSRRIWCESSDSDDDYLTIDPDYVPRDDVSEDEDPNQENSRADNINKPSSENTSDEDVSDKIDKSNATQNEPDGSSSGIDATDFEKLDLDYVRSLVGKLLQSYGCRSDSNEISKTDEPSDERTENVPTEAAQSHVPNLTKLCKNKLGSLLTPAKCDSSNDTAEASKPKAEYNFTEADTKRELEEKLTSYLKNEVPITNHVSVSESGVTGIERIRSVINKTAAHLYTMKVGGPTKKVTNKIVAKNVDKICYYSGSSGVVNDLKEIKMDFKSKPLCQRLNPPEDVVVILAPNKGNAGKFTSKSFQITSKTNSETATPKDDTDSQTDLEKSTENIEIQSPSNTVKGHVIKNPILLQMLKSQSCDMNRSLQFASRQNTCNNNVIDVENTADDVVMTEDEVKSEIDPKLIMFPLVEIERVNLALMSRHWREIRRICLYDVPPSYLFKNNNLSLLKKCRPCGVFVERLEWEERESVGSRVAKKVELQNIDDVRRNNRNILTAQVAPITVDQSEAGAAARQLVKLRARNASLSAENLRSLLQRYSGCETGLCARCARCLARPPPADRAVTYNPEKERRNRARQRHKERNSKRPRSPYEEDPEEAKRRWIREKNIAAEKFGVKPRVLKKKAVEQPPAPITQTFGHHILSSIEKIDGLNKTSGNYVINDDGSIQPVDLEGPNTDNVNTNVSTNQNPPTVPLILNKTSLQPSTYLPLTVENLLEHAKNQPIFKLDSNLFNPNAVANIKKTLNDLTEAETTEFNPVITNVQSLADTKKKPEKQSLLNNIVPQIRKRHFDSGPEEPPKKVAYNTQTVKAKPQVDFSTFKILTENVEIMTNTAPGIIVNGERRFRKKIEVRRTLPNLIPMKVQAVGNEQEIARKQLSLLKTNRFSVARTPSLEITPVERPPTNPNQTNLQTVQTFSRINLKRTQIHSQKNDQVNMQNAQTSQSNMQKTIQTNLPNKDSQGKLQQLAPRIITQIPSCDLQSIQTSIQTNLQNAQSPNSDMQKTTQTNAQKIQDSQGNLQTIDLQKAQNAPWNVRSIQTSPHLQNEQSSNCNIPEATPQINLLNAQNSQTIQTVSQTNLCVQNPPVSFHAQENSQMSLQNVQINQQINLQNVQTNSQMTLQTTQTNQVNYIWTNTQPGANVDLTNQIKILNHQLPTNQPTIPLQLNTAQQVSTTLNSNFNVILSNGHQNALQVNSVQAGPSLINSYLPNQLGLLSNQVMPLNSVQAGPSSNSLLVVPAQDNLNTLSPQLFGPAPLQVTAVQAGPSLQDSADKAEETQRSVGEPRKMQNRCSSQFFPGADVDPLSMGVKTAAQYIAGRDPTALVVLAGRWPRGALLLLREAAADVRGPVFGLAPPCRILQPEEDTPAPKTPEEPKIKPPWLKVRSFARITADPPEGETLSSSNGRVVAPRRVFLHDKVYHKLSDAPLIYAKVLTPVESPQQLRSIVGELRPLFVYSMGNDQLHTVQPELSPDGSNIIISGPGEISPVIFNIGRHVLSHAGADGELRRISSEACMIPKRVAVETELRKNGNNSNGNNSTRNNVKHGNIKTVNNSNVNSSNGNNITGNNSTRNNVKHGNIKTVNNSNVNSSNGNNITGNNSTRNNVKHGNIKTVNNSNGNNIHGNIKNVSNCNGNKKHGNIKTINNSNSKNKHSILKTVNNSNGNKPTILNGQLPRGPHFKLHYPPAVDAVIDLDTDSD